MSAKIPRKIIKKIFSAEEKLQQDRLFNDFIESERDEKRKQQGIIVLGEFEFLVVENSDDLNNVVFTLNKCSDELLSLEDKKFTYKVSMIVPKEYYEDFKTGEVPKSDKIELFAIMNDLILGLHYQEYKGYLSKEDKKQRNIANFWTCEQEKKFQYDNFMKEISLFKINNTRRDKHITNAELKIMIDKHIAELSFIKEMIAKNK